MAGDTQLEVYKGAVLEVQGTSHIAEQAYKGIVLEVQGTPIDREQAYKGIVLEVRGVAAIDRDIPLWIDNDHIMESTPVVRATFRERFSAFFAARATLEAALTEAARRAMKTVNDSAGNHIEVDGDAIKGVDATGNTSWVLNGAEGPGAIYLEAIDLTDNSGQGLINSTTWQYRDFQDASLPANHIYNRARYAIVELKILGTVTDDGTFEIGPNSTGDDTTRMRFNQYAYVKEESYNGQIQPWQFIVPLVQRADSTSRRLFWHFYDTIGGTPQMMLLLRGFIA